MASIRQGWHIQTRVIQALIIRELTTRFGRENIGFRWVMAEPLLFAVLVGLLWRFEKGPQEHGVNIIAFVATGYLPLVMFRSTVLRAMGSFAANSSLMYHRQVKIIDLILVRFFVEMIGHLMAYLFIGTVLFALDQFPWPHDLGFLLLGFSYYALFSLTVAMVVAPLSELSEVLEKIMPVTTYLMVPFSGAFFMAEWLTPNVKAAVLWSPPVHAMEMMRYGVFGDALYPNFSFYYTPACCLPVLMIGLMLCRHVSRVMVVE
jgi:capsular polysaccharide transport system permease protein